MKKLSWTNWSIRTRLMLITVFPVLYLFVSVVAYSYHSRLTEGHEELAERARSVAIALAEGVEYNVLAANLSALQRSVNAVVQSDRNIDSVDIFNASRVAIVHVGSGKPGKADAQFFEVPIKRQMVWVSLVSAEENVPVPAAAGTVSGNSDIKSEILGYVRVTMSPDYMLAKQTRRFLIESAMALLALVVSAVLGLILSKSLTWPLNKSIEALSEIRDGDYAIRVEVTTGGEIGQLQSSINDMSVSLYQSKQDLENKVQARTKDLMVSRNEALSADAEKRRLIQKINSIVEDERKSIAIEIHDELNASLIAARLESQRILHLSSKVQLNEAAQDQATEALQEILPEIQARARAIIKLTLDLYASGRNLVRRLRPEVLELLGLQGAIEEMLRYLNAPPSTCHFAFQAVGDFAQLPSELAISVYRIIQEALSNVVKHASAKRVEISLDMDTTPDQLAIRIDDDGTGFDVAATSAGIGIAGMRERVAALNGEFLLESAAGAGTHITIRLPCVLSPSTP